MELIAVALALSLNAAQEQTIRAAAAHYPGLQVEIVVEPDAPARYRRFAERLRSTLELAGLRPDLNSGATVSAECPHRAGIRVAYTPERSGPATRIAEAFQRARVIGGSVPSCSLPGTGVLRFLIAG